MSELAQAAQKSGRMHDHSRSALNERLDHQRSNLPVMSTQQLFGFRKKQLRGGLRHGPGRQATRIREWQPDHFEQQRFEQCMKPSDATDARAAQRIAMIGFAESDEICLARLWVLALPPVLKSHFECEFNGGRTVAGKKNMLKVSRCN